MQNSKLTDYLNRVNADLGLQLDATGCEALAVASSANRCWKIDSDLGALVVRQHRTSGLHQQGSWRFDLDITQAMSKNGIGAPLLHHDTASQSMLLRWCGEHQLSAPLSEQQIKSLAGVVAQLHIARGEDLRLVEHYSYRADLKQYLDLADSKAKAFRDTCIPLIESSLAAAEYLDQDEQNHCLCHHDLNSNNIVWMGDKPTLIDWEYCRRAHPAFDVASLIIWCKLDQQQQQLLVDCYGQKTKKLSTASLQAANKMVHVLDKLWQMLENGA